MIKRIKKYKLFLRPSVVLRNFKKKFPQKESDLEKKIDLETKRVQKFFYPYSTYETYSREELPEALEELWSKGQESSIAISLIASTIGNAFENEVKKAQMNADLFQTALLESIGAEALDQSFAFASKLLQEESKLEGCECSVPLSLESSYHQEILKSLQVQESEISMNAEGILTPVYSRVGFCFWTQIKNR